MKTYHLQSLLYLAAAIGKAPIVFFEGADQEYQFRELLPEQIEKATSFMAFHQGTSWDCRFEGTDFFAKRIRP